MGLKRAQQREAAALSLATGKTVAEAATSAQTTERSVYRWYEEGAFRARVDALRGEMVSRACGELADAMGAAAKKLRELVDSDAEGIALRASQAIIESTLKVTELVELQKRVEELERRLTEAETHGT